METLRVIDRLKFFESLTPTEKETVSNLRLRVFKYDPGAKIIKANSQDTNLYIIIRGTATVVGGKGEPVAILQPGEVFGEISFLVSRPRSASVVANNEVIVMRVDKENFQGLEPPLREKFKDKLIQIIVDRLVAKTEKSLEISSSFGWDKA